jgi:hypothetical protein
MVDVTTAGGIKLSDVIKFFAGTSWDSFSNENGAGIRLISHLTSQESV